MNKDKKMSKEEMIKWVKKKQIINYDRYIEQVFSEKEPIDLVDTWIYKYERQCGSEISILLITLDNYTFVYDETYERVVVVYGIPDYKSLGEKKRRDKSRIAYYYRNFIKRNHDIALMDTGHYIAHSLGGSLDLNLFSQKRELNRGYSLEGKLYRSMENYALKNENTFIFSRPIYFNNSWEIPSFLEYGITKEKKFFFTHIFENM